MANQKKLNENQPTPPQPQPTPSHPQTALSDPLLHLSKPTAPLHEPLFFPSAPLSPLNTPVNEMSPSECALTSQPDTIMEPVSAFLGNFMSEEEIVSDLTKHVISFYRRPDLTPELHPEIRAIIGHRASLAKKYGPRGTITSLAREYGISRTFVYILAAKVDMTIPILFGVIYFLFFGKHLHT